MIKHLMANALVFVAIMILGLQGTYVLRAVQARRALESSPITYSELIPDKEEYAPGELVKFKFDRTTNAENKALPLLILTVDSFENLDTGEIFQGLFASRIIRRNGVEHLNALRRLSADCTPGTYSFEGWISFQGTFPAAAVAYSSRKFVIKQQP